jgi:hypothetical protein
VLGTAALAGVGVVFWRRARQFGELRTEAPVAS